MMIRLNKIRLFLLGVIIIVVLYFIRQVEFINGSEIVSGIHIYSAETLEGYEVPEVMNDIVVFKINGEWMVLNESYGKAYRYNGNMPLELYSRFGKEVPVIYKKADPSRAKPYTFFGFWFENIAYFIVPLFLWSAFSLSYLDKGETLTFNFRERSFGKSKYRKNADDRYFKDDRDSSQRLG